MFSSLQGMGTMNEFLNKTANEKLNSSEKSYFSKSYYKIYNYYYIYFKY